MFCKEQNKIFVTSRMTFHTEESLLRHYTREVETLFKKKYRDYLSHYRNIQQDPSLEREEKIQLWRSLSWKTFQLRIMIAIYLNMLRGNHLVSSFYIHHIIFQLEEMLTPSMREQHSVLLVRHEQVLMRLVTRIREKIYVDVNHNIYVFYNP